ncbi:MAG: hypothetical protein AAF429_07355 [Pseudomonadota bacterium]
MPNPHAATAKAFNALAHPRRITLFHLIRAETPNRPNFGMLLRATKFTPAVLAHHLRVMEKGGLIRRFQVGSFTEFVTLERSYDIQLAPITQILTEPLLKAA